MFRLYKHVPDVYVNESRDFQLLCRLFDFLFNGIKYDVDSILNINDAFKINERLLPLLAIKEGFITDVQLESKALRYILKAFPYIVKYKGTKKGITLAVNTILKLEASSDVPDVRIDNDKTITIVTKLSRLENRKALEEILKYIIPVGSDLKLIYDRQSKTEEMTSITLNKALTMVNYAPLVGSVFDSRFSGQIPSSVSSAEKYMKENYVYTINSEVIDKSFIQDPSGTDVNKYDYIKGTTINTTSGEQYYKEEGDTDIYGKEKDN